MNIFKKALSYVLILAVLISVFPAAVFAEEDEYRISNQYMRITLGGFYCKTAGFLVKGKAHILV